MASVTPPLEITDARLTDSSIAEPDLTSGEQGWDSAGGYSEGDKVIVAEKHWEWELAAGGDGTQPPPAAGTSDDNWLSVGPSNKWRAFDLYQDTASVGPSPWSVEITPGKRINTVALDGIVGDHITITQSKDGDEIYRYETELSMRPTTTWSEYLYGEFKQQPMVFRQDLKPASGAVLTVEITRDLGNVEVGALIVGTSIYIGTVEVNPDSDALNFSTVDRSQSGKAKIVRRRSVPRTSQRVLYDHGAADKLRKARRDLDATVAFWSGLDDGSAVLFGLFAFIGFYTRWLISPGEGDALYQQLEIEGY